MLAFQPMLLSIVVAAATSAGVPGQGTGGIFTCKGPRGEALTSDREITGCAGEQIERNRDGSLKRIVPPPKTEDEKAADEERLRLSEQQRMEQRVQRRKENALQRLYPDQDTLQKARQRELAPTVAAIQVAQSRTQDLMKVRKGLSDNAEFYPKGPLPARLQADLDANDAALAAQKQLQQNLQDELKRINANFDNDLTLLRMLWARKVNPGK